MNEDLRRHLNEILDIMLENPGLELIIEFVPNYLHWNPETQQHDVPEEGVIVEIRRVHSRAPCLIYGRYVHTKYNNTEDIKREIDSYYKGTHVASAYINYPQEQTEEDKKRQAVKAALRAQWSEAGLFKGSGK